MFETDFGCGIAAKAFAALAQKRVIFVTQENLLLKYFEIIPQFLQTVCLDNIEESFMNETLRRLPPCDVVVGFGGGLAIDGAKYIAWRTGTPCELFPTAVSVDAVYSYPIALRRKKVVEYVGEVIPRRIAVDYDIIRSAPLKMNLSGAGDVLSIYTALWDWELMDRAGKGHPIVGRQYEGAQKVLSELLDSGKEIAGVTDKGISVIMNGYKWVGIEGYNSRYCHFEEGSEHYLAYTVESVCGKHLLHGQLVCICAYIASKMQKEGRQKTVADFTRAIGLPIKPEDVGLTQEELRAALWRVNSFVREKDLPYSVWNEKDIEGHFINEVLAELEK